MIKRFFIIGATLAVAFFYAKWEKDRFELNLETGDDQYVLKSVPETSFLDITKKSDVDLVKSVSSESAQYVFIHFWATWCAPCEVELPDLIKFVQTTERQKAAFYFVAVNDEEVKVQKHFEKFNKILEELNVKLLIDNKAQYYQRFGTAKVPETYVFRVKDLKLVRKFVGPQEWTQKRYRDFLNSLK